MSKLAAIPRLDPGRREAYRYLLYAALVNLRTGPGPLRWWSPWSWWRMRGELLQDKAVADCFHNLAWFSLHDFEGFEEARFWQDVEHLAQQHGRAWSERIRRSFEEYVGGEYLGGRSASLF